MEEPVAAAGDFLGNLFRKGGKAIYQYHQSLHLLDDFDDIEFYIG